MHDLAARITPLLPELTAFRHDLHAHPELRFQEHRTAERILSELRKLPGLHLRAGVAGTGIVATLGADRPGPCLALRADMDALPITEATGLPYASRTPGMAHSCGHDGHVTCLLGAARVLTGLADRLQGPVKFIFQPAEESGAGGRTLCEAGALEDPPVAAAYALHAWSSLPIGAVAAREGAAMASTDNIDIALVGQGTHAAAPHCGADPIVAAAQLVLALQTVVARRLPPQEPAVVTIASIHGGTTRNVIPPRVELVGTIRTLDAEARRTAVEAVRQIATHTAAALGVEAEINLEPRYPVLINDARLTALFRETARAELGAAALHDDPVSLGGEDFAFYGQRTPVMMWRLGVARPGTTQEIPLHSPRFDFADEAIATGVRLHCALALRFNAAGGLPAA